MKPPIKIALAKGRILDTVLPLLKDIGVEPVECLQQSRKLVLKTSVENIELVILRNADVPTFVQFGATHLGMVGKDVLLEHGGDGLAELLDLGVAQCRLVVAEPVGIETNSQEPTRRLRVATKYPKVTQHYFASRGIQADIIKLYGSMELAPMVGLADRIVDLVDTGKTLQANSLIEVEQIAQVSARLIANLAALRMRSTRLHELIELINSAVRSDSKSP